MYVESERDGSIATLALNWPERRNALGEPQAKELLQALNSVAESDAAVLVLTGRGAFCSGGDLRGHLQELGNTGGVDEVRANIEGVFQQLTVTLRGFPIPTIAAVDGAAVGAGMDLALSCDMRFIGPEGSFSAGWPRLGLIPALGGVFFLNKVAPDLIWRMLAAERRLDAVACSTLGIAELGLPSGLTAAVERGESLARHGRELLSDYVRLARGGDVELGAHLSLCASLQAPRFLTEEFHRRVREALGAVPDVETRI